MTILRRLDRPLVHTALLWAWVVTFTFAPAWINGIPLSRQLSSDAEFYASVMQASTEAGLNAAGTSLEPGLLPATERTFLAGIASLAAAMRVDLLEMSVAIELAAALFFAAALYWLLLDQTRSRSTALVATLIGTLGVHALGGTVFGFEPRGFLPRDAALGGAVALLNVFLRARSDRERIAVFFAAGVLANAYSVLFAHLVAVLILATVLRRGRPTASLLRYAGAALLGAAPTVIDVVTSPALASPPDPEVYRLRAGYLLLDQGALAVAQYLRRPVLAAIVAALVVFLARKRWTTAEGERAAPWIAIAVSAAIMATLGVALEQGTPFARLLLSRTSVFLILSSMVLCLLALPAVFRGRLRRPALAGLLTASAFFLLQSNLPTDVRALASARSGASSRIALVDAADQLRVRTAASDLFIAPSSDAEDLAATIRTYAIRPAYITYKDLGIVFYDGVRARALYVRWTATEAALAGDRAGLLRFMTERGIRAAVLRDGSGGYSLLLR